MTTRLLIKPLSQMTVFFLFFCLIAAKKKQKQGKAEIIHTFLYNFRMFQGAKTFHLICCKSKVMKSCVTLGLSIWTINTEAIRLVVVHSNWHFF